jgi:hypothetical protein
VKGTWQTTDSGGAGAVALVIGAAVLAAAIAGPVAAAVGELLRVLVIFVAVVIVLALAAVGAAVAYRLRRGRASGTTAGSLPRPVPRRPIQAVSEPQPPAIEALREVHLHFHGVTAEDVAAIIARVNHEDRQRGQANGQS